MSSPVRKLNPWKLSTLLLSVALAVVIGTDHVGSAEAAGPARLGKALSALKASKKHLEDAKEPPAPFHAQSLAMVNQAITAVEREIKAYEANKEKSKDKEKDKDRDKEKGAKSDSKGAKKKDAPSKSKASHDASDE